MISSTRTSREHSMDEPEVLRDHELWTDGLEEMLVDILYQETIEGKLVGSKITNRYHLRLVEKLSRVGRKAIDESQIRGKITHLRQRLRLFTDLMGQTGMGWNPQIKTVMATEEHWANAIKVRSQWRKFKTYGCRDYDLLCTIFDQSVVTGVCHFASTLQPPMSEEKDCLEEKVRAQGPVLETTMEAPIDIDGPNINGPVGRQRQYRRRTKEPVQGSISLEFSKTLKVMTTSATMRTELDKQFFEECNRKHSKSYGIEFGSDVSYSKMGAYVVFIDTVIYELFRIIDFGSGSDDELQIKANNTTETGSSGNQPPGWDDYELGGATAEESALPVFEQMPEHNIGLRERDYIVAILNGHPNNCWNIFWMEIYAFEALCNTLRGNEYLESTREVSVEEALAIFAYTVRYAQVQRITGDRFQHSSETINRHVYAVMCALCNLALDVISPTHTTGVAP
ncbi:L10-interacting MYB domain-containing protein-like [Juglans microcarpa x Juglans regia]|uniref:L10-interacting MYB domain-containing protein-like n=1 Tax=Juglans microcarpa x Juglans regia TaxID=2249226 RepID=UPI001B7E0569|nr:L10-interacting MYB domain-containing protein-like [Juglans microcarpa x Juglans regia]